MSYLCCFVVKSYISALENAGCGTLNNLQPCSLHKIGEKEGIKEKGYLTEEHYNLLLFVDHETLVGMF